MQSSAKADIKICHSCVLKEEKRNPKKEKDTVEKVNIVLELPRQTQIEIEEICINQGISFSKYFQDLHEKSKDEDWINSVQQLGKEIVDEGTLEFEEKPMKKSKMAKK